MSEADYEEMKAYVKRTIDSPGPTLDLEKLRASTVTVSLVRTEDYRRENFSWVPSLEMEALEKKLDSMPRSPIALREVLKSMRADGTLGWLANRRLRTELRAMYGEPDSLRVEWRDLQPGEGHKVPIICRIA